MVNWRDLIAPRYAQAPVVLPQLRAAVDVGTFLKLKEPVTMGPGGRTVLVRLISWEHVRDEDRIILCVNLYLVDNPRGTRRETLTRHMAVARQTRYADSLPAESVEDICYVFHQEDLESIKYYAQGRSDSFVTGDTITPQAFVTFPCEHPSFRLRTSFCRRLWCEMETTRRLFRNILGSPRIDQDGSHVSSIYLSTDTWEYLMRQFLRQDGVTYIQEKPRPCSRVDNEFIPGGGSRAVRRTYPASELVVDDLNAILHVLGQATVFGVRRRKPKLSDGDRPLILNNVLSIPRQAVLTHFDVTLRLRLYYGEYQYAVNNNGTIVGCPDEQLLRFLRKQAPLPPPDEEVEMGMFLAFDLANLEFFHLGYQHSIVGENPEEDAILLAGRVYDLFNERRRILGLRYGGRFVEFETIDTNEYLLVSREAALENITGNVEFSQVGFNLA